MRDYMQFYIDGKWVDPVTPKSLDVINPATEEVAGHISAGSAADVDKAVAAARKAFETYSRTSREERIDLLERVQAEYQKRFGDIAKAITEEMGAPASLAQRAQAPIGIAQPMGVDDNIEARLGRADRQGEADAARAAGDQGPAPIAHGVINRNARTRCGSARRKRPRKSGWPGWLP